MTIVSSPPAYLFLCFMLSTSTILFGVVLFAMRVPREANLRQYNIARHVLAAAYFSIGIFNCYKTFICLTDRAGIDLIRTLTLISASYQALLFTFALLILIQPTYVSMRRVSLQFGMISFAFLSLLLLKNIFPSRYHLIYNAASVLYILQLIYYTLLFRRKYALYAAQLKEYYNENENDRLRWVKHFFYLALSTGTGALLMTLLPSGYNLYFIPAIIAFYIFFGIKYYNYPLNFRYVVSAVYSNHIAGPTPDTEMNVADVADGLQPLSPKEQKLQQAIDKWVEEKQFQNTDMSRDDIAKSLGTDRDFLAFFFQTRMGIEFRIWRTQLRIEEAKELLLKYPELSISKIGDRVGISDRSNFQKKFIESVGMSPKDWREYNTHNKNQFSRLSWLKQ